MASSVTASSDMTPSPRAKVDIEGDDLNADTVEVTVWQVSKWGQVTVRGGERKNAVGGYTITDYELPAGVEVTYRVEEFDEDGENLGYGGLSLTGQVEIPFGSVVIQDPLAPASAIMLKAQPDFASSLRRSRPVVVYQAGDRSFAMSGLQSGFKSVPLSVWTKTDEEREKLQEILQQPVILVRTPPEMRLPGAFYAVVAETDQDASWGRFDLDADKWPLRGEQVSRPDLEVIVPIYTYDLFKAYIDEKYGPPYGTYEDAAAEWASYLDALRNPPSYI